MVSGHLAVRILLLLLLPLLLVVVVVRPPRVARLTRAPSKIREKGGLRAAGRATRDPRPA